MGNGKKVRCTSVELDIITEIPGEKLAFGSRASERTNGDRALPVSEDTGPRRQSVGRGSQVQNLSNKQSQNRSTAVKNHLPVKVSV